MRGSLNVRPSLRHQIVFSIRLIVSSFFLFSAFVHASTLAQASVGGTGCVGPSDTGVTSASSSASCSGGSGSASANISTGSVIPGLASILNTQTAASILMMPGFVDETALATASSDTELVVTGGFGQGIITFQFASTGTLGGISTLGSFHSDFQVMEGAGPLLSDFPGVCVFLGSCTLMTQPFDFIFGVPFAFNLTLFNEFEAGFTNGESGSGEGNEMVSLIADQLSDLQGAPITGTVEVVPEPLSIALCISGIVVLLALRKISVPPRNCS